MTKKITAIVLIMITILTLIPSSFSLPVSAADLTEYITMPVHTIKQTDIIGAVIEAPDDKIVNYNPSTGVIKGLDMGVTSMKIEESDGDIVTVNMTMYTVYPQPKTANANKVVTLRKYASKDSPLTTETKAYEEPMDLLYHTTDEAGDNIQYTGDGWINNDDNTDRGATTYNVELIVNNGATKDSSSFGTGRAAGGYHSDNDYKITTGSSNISIKKDKNDEELCEATAEKEGYAIVTATSRGEEVTRQRGTKTSIAITVYTTFGNSYLAIAKKDSLVRRGASKDSQILETKETDSDVTISGECGDYYRVGERRFMLKSDITIPEATVTTPDYLAMKKSAKPAITPTYSKYNLDMSNKTSNKRNINWKTGNVKIATVTGADSNKNGKLAGKGFGITYSTVKVPTLKQKDGKNIPDYISAKTAVSVYKPVKKTFIVSVKEKKKDKKGKKTIDRKVHIGAATPTKDKFSELVAKDEKIATNTLLKVIGRVDKPKNKDKGYYYVKYVNEPSKKMFINKNDVEKINLRHKQLVVKQIYTPYMKEGKAKSGKLIKNSKTTKKVNGKNVTTTFKTTATSLSKNGALNINEKKVGKEKVPSGTLTAKKQGIDFIHIVRKKTVKEGKKKPKTTKTTKLYRFHVSVPEKVSKRVGRTVATGTETSVQTYHCAAADCPKEQIKVNKQVSILAEASDFVKIEFIETDKNKKKTTKTRFVYKKNVAYIVIDPIVILRENKDDATEEVTFKDVAEEEEILRTAKTRYQLKDTKNTDIAKAKFDKDKKTVTATYDKKNKTYKDEPIKDKNGKPVKNKKGEVKTKTVKKTYTNGYTWVKVTAGYNSQGKEPKKNEEGRFKAYAPISVVEPIKSLFNSKKNKKYTGYIKHMTSFKNGASEKNKYSVVLGKLKAKTKVTVIGKAGAYFYVKCENKNLGMDGYGFVKKTAVVYMAISTTRINAGLKQAKKYVTIKTYNTKKSQLEWKGKNGKVAFDDVSSSTKNKILTAKYYVRPKYEGTADAYIKHKSSPMRADCFVSVFTYWGIQGYMKDDTTTTERKYQKYKCASENKGEDGKKDELTYAKITGKCDDYFFINGKAWVKVSTVSYISMWTDSKIYAMYRFTRKDDIYSKLVRDAKDNKIKFSLSSDKAEIKEEFSNGDSRSLKLKAHKAGTVNVVATYYYNGDKKITRNLPIEIVDVYLNVSPKKKTLKIIKTTHITPKKTWVTKKHKTKKLTAKISYGRKIPGVSLIKTKNIVWKHKSGESVKFDKDKHKVTTVKNGISKIKLTLFDLVKIITITVETKKKTDKKAIIIVPGIMGSELFESSNINKKTKIWEPSGWYNDQIAMAYGVKRLACNKDGSSKEPKIVAGNLTTGADSQYKKLHYTLSNKYGEKYFMHFFAYDWRMANSASAKLLDKYIKSHKYSKVTIVAHSMGGLVASHYLARGKKQRKKVKKLITLGTPFLGAPMAIDALSNGNILDGVAWWLFKYGTGIFQDNSVMPYIALNMKGMYELIPTKYSFSLSKKWADFNRKKLISSYYSKKTDELAFNLNYKKTVKKVYKKIENFNKNIFALSQKAHKSLFVNGKHISEFVDTYYVVGGGVRTLTSFRADINSKGKLKCIPMYESQGDGTVPIWSACAGKMYSNKTFYYDYHEHGGGLKDNSDPNSPVTKQGLLSSNKIMQLIPDIIDGKMKNHKNIYK